MGALKHFWRNPYADLRAKKQIFLAIPANLLLWGCETWALRQHHIDRLNVFWHRAIRNILGIRISEVIDEHISNERIRKIFHDIPDAEAMLNARSMTYLGKIARAPNQHPPKHFITAWVDNPRLPAGVLMTNKKALVRGINALIPEHTTEKVKIKCKKTGVTRIEDRLNPNGKLDLWLPTALNKKLWEWHIYKLTHPNTPLPPKPPESTTTEDQDATDTNQEDDDPPSDDNQREHNSQHRDHRNSHRDHQRPRDRDHHQETPSDPAHNHTRRDYNPDNVGRNRMDSLRALGLQPNATQSEIKHRFRRLSLIYHPDKYSDTILDISKDDSTSHFQLLNNAYDYLRNQNRSN